VRNHASAKKIFGLLATLFSLTAPCEAIHLVKTSWDLYAAITDINNGDADTFIELSENVVLTAPLPPISKSMTFQSDKLGSLRTVNADTGRNGKRRVFHVLSDFGLTVKFQDLEITGNTAALSAGGLYLSKNATLRLNKTTLKENRTGGHKSDLSAE
jgi:hypothetical protein